MNTIRHVTRRDFMKTTAVAGGGLLIGLHLPIAGRPLGAATAATDGAVLNAWAHIHADNTITLTASQTEMGQGPTMGNLMMFAEEMECDWNTVTFAFDTGREEYTNPLFGYQGTGGSSATTGFWDVMRTAGAQTRHMLIQAAAKHWGVDPVDCSARNSVVTYRGPDGEKTATFGELAVRAAEETPPENPRLKSPDEFHLIGTAVSRLDNEVKVTGKAKFGIDHDLEGMVIGAIRHAPFGGTLASFDEAAAMAMPGVNGVVEVGHAVYPENNTPALIVTADSYWQAEQGMKAANPQWDPGDWGDLDSDHISQTLLGALDNETGVLARAEGDVDTALDQAAQVVEATYEVPYVGHAPLEPQNCLADFRGDSLEVWAPTQFPGGGYIAMELLTGLPRDKIKIHMTFTGGGFGRRAENDFMEQAVEASMKLKRPVKLIWSREEDMQNNFNRPAYAAKMTAGLDADGQAVAWRHKTAGPAVWTSPYRSSRLQDVYADTDWIMGAKESGLDADSVQGAMAMAYAFANLEVSVVQKDFPVPIGPYRAVGNTQDSFFMDCFLDEVAHAAGQDPYRFRRALLAEQPRMQAVLDLAAEKSGWDEPPAKGHYRGIAFHHSFESPFADVVEISIRGGKRVTIHRIVRAVDCGIVVNPDQWDAQMQSGVVWGLAHAFLSEHTVRYAKLMQSNYDTYKLPRIGQMPPYEAYAVDSKNPPTGLGEPAFTTVTPAICNAIFAATGKRIRTLPLKKHGMSLA